MSDSNNGLHYPQLRWPISGWWFTVVGAIAGLAILMFPSLSLLNDIPRFFVCLILIILPVAFILLSHIARCIRVCIKRASRFEQQSLEIRSLKERLGAAQRALAVILQQRHKQNTFEIAYCYAFNHKTLIALRKKQGRKPTVGASVTVIDQGNGALMGEFRVYRDSGKHFTCELVGYIDVLWLGYVKQHGAGHSEPPPEAVAWVLPGAKGEEIDDSEEKN